MVPFAQVFLAGGAEGTLDQVKNFRRQPSGYVLGVDDIEQGLELMGHGLKDEMGIRGNSGQAMATPLVDIGVMG